MIKQYQANRVLFKASKHETADWIREHPDSLQVLFKSKIKILNHQYPVVVRFMPMHFQTVPAGLRELELDAKLDPFLIARVSWIKDPARRAPSQRYANIKVFCKTLRAANTLIMSSP